MMRGNLAALARSIRDLTAIGVACISVGLATQWACSNVDDHILISLAVVFSFAAMVRQ